MSEGCSKDLINCSSIALFSRWEGGGGLPDYLVEDRFLIFLFISPCLADEIVLFALFVRNYAIYATPKLFIKNNFVQSTL